jgi:hypothetical protein
MAEKGKRNFKSDGQVTERGLKIVRKVGPVVFVEDPSGGPFSVAEYIANNYLDRLKHPEIQKLIKDGTWEKMSNIGKIWMLQDLYPLPREASEFLIKIAEKASDEYDALTAAENAKEAAENAKKAHPEIQKLIKDGTWDKMSLLQQRWMLEDLDPYPLEVSDPIMKICKKASDEYDALTAAENAKKAAEKTKKAVKKTKKAAKTSDD